MQLNTQLGTALLNAYKHVPTMGSPGVTDALISRVERILSQLVAQRHANTQTFALVAAVHAQVCGVCVCVCVYLCVCVCVCVCARAAH